MNFLFKYKKIFLGLGILVAAAIMGYLIYFLFFYQEPDTPPSGESGTETGERGELPTAGEGEGREGATPGEGLPGEETGERGDGGEEGEGRDEDVTPTTSLNDTPSLGSTLAPDGEGVQYYNQDDGKFYRVDKDGNITAMSDEEFHDVDNVNWAPNKNKAILEYPDGSNTVYDFEEEKQVTLPDHWEDFDFSPDSDEIVMKSMGKDPDNRWLAVSDDEGGDVTPIEKMGNNADSVHPNWSPNEQIIGMHTEGESFDRQKVHFLGKNDENFQSINVEGRGFQPKWSKEGDKLLYSVHSSDNGMNPQLWSTNAKPGNIATDRKSLGVNTWAEKCTFHSNDEAYCGVPQDLPEGSGLTPELAEDSSDQLYKINTETGSKELVATPEGEHNVSDIQVSEDGSTLFFTDSKTEEVHKIDLE